MANTKSAVATAIDAGVMLDVRQVLGRLKIIETTVPLAAQANGDTIELFDLPAGFRPLAGVLHASVGLGGTATVAIGVAGTAGKYRAAATFNTADVPTLFGVGANMMATLGAKERVILTIGAAALPGAGTFKVAFIGTVGD